MLFGRYQVIRITVFWSTVVEVDFPPTLQGQLEHSGSDASRHQTAERRGVWSENVMVDFIGRKVGRFRRGRRGRSRTSGAVRPKETNERRFVGGWRLMLLFGRKQRGENPEAGFRALAPRPRGRSALGTTLRRSAAHVVSVRRDPYEARLSETRELAPRGSRPLGGFLNKRNFRERKPLVGDGNFFSNVGMGIHGFGEIFSQIFCRTGSDQGSDFFVLR